MDTLTIHIDFKSSESFQDLINRLNRLEQLLLSLSGQSVNTCKQVMTFNETAQYLGVSKSYLYKLTSTQRIPHYKPTGKRICFDLNELNEWRK
jgi:excisionase family DNA binding protein